MRATANVRQYGRTLADATRAASALLAPWLDLVIRLWLAQSFLVVQMRQFMTGTPWPAAFGAGWWASALHGAMVSTPGQVVQTVCPLLLAAGLLARPAAAAMVVGGLAMPMAAGGAWWLWVALLLRIVLLGPGQVSVDALI